MKKREALEAATMESKVQFTITGLDGICTLHSFERTSGARSYGAYCGDYRIGNIEFRQNGLYYYMFHTLGKKIHGLIKYSDIQIVTAYETEKQIAA